MATLTWRSRWLAGAATGLAFTWMVVSLAPLADDAVARWQARRAIRALREAPRASQGAAIPEALLAPPPSTPALTSWGDLGGCGIGGGSAAAGSIRWIGRGVTGGRVDLQEMGSATRFRDGSSQLLSNTRVGTSLLEKWPLAVNVPFLYKVGEVNVFGTPRTAHLAGFGDVSVEVTRRLGIDNSSSLTLSLNLPTGSFDAVREGVVLPQQLQLGPGKPSASLLFEHSRDSDWSLLLYGASLSSGGLENSLGDFRAPSASAWIYAGYLWGRFVPSVGLTLTSKLMRDRQRYSVISDQPMVTAAGSLGLEWSCDWLAILLATSLPLSSRGVEAMTFSLGLQTSVF
jgi:hypothetical protein